MFLIVYTQNLLVPVYSYLCGPVSIQMVESYFFDEDNRNSLEYIAERTLFAQYGGVHVFNMGNYLASRGLYTSIVHFFDPTPILLYLEENQIPAILLIRSTPTFGHAVVFTGFNRRRGVIRVLDPEAYVTSISYQDFFIPGTIIISNNRINNKRVFICRLCEHDVIVDEQLVAAITRLTCTNCGAGVRLSAHR